MKILDLTISDLEHFVLEKLYNREVLDYINMKYKNFKIRTYLN